MKPLDLQWDIFCQVIDNHGDLGVCWRLAKRLSEPGHRVHLYIDEPSALTWMAPLGHPNVKVKAWPTQDFDFEPFQLPDVVVEAFGCEIPERYLSRLAKTLQSLSAPKPWVWINLEYLSAQPYVERMHQMPSPVSTGPMAGHTKWFFYPGFTPKTAGLLSGFKSKTPQSPTLNSTLPYWVLFCYEPKALTQLIQQLRKREAGVILKVTPGRAQNAVRWGLNQLGIASKESDQILPLGPSQIEFLPYLSQLEFDDLLAQSELNFVRGEDSWVRAIWAQKPFVWQIYPQTDHAHEDKLQSFLHRFSAPTSLIEAHLSWNAMSNESLPILSPEVLFEWKKWSEALSQQLSQHPELGSSLEHFVAQKLIPQ
jgi:uncharacterized repeat protein (TIGR03837 family)